MKTASGKADVSEEVARRQRKARSDTYEAEAQRIFSDYRTTRTDQAQAALEVLGEKMCRDIVEQGELVLKTVDRAENADRETARLLRMMEARHANLLKLDKALSTDNAIMERARACLLVRGSDAHN